MYFVLIHYSHDFPALIQCKSYEEAQKRMQKYYENDVKFCKKENKAFTTEAGKCYRRLHRTVADSLTEYYVITV